METVKGSFSKLLKIEELVVSFNRIVGVLRDVKLGLFSDLNDPW
jgi:hypothetical protein